MAGVAEPHLNECPASFTDWEGALARRFLAVGIGGDASPITCFEVTPETLAEASGITGPQAEETAIASFKEQVCRIGLRDALEHGQYSQRAASEETPGFFCYLALTLLIASSPDEDNRLGGDFHEKLRRFLGVTSGYRALPGVAQMWRRLAHWLDERHSQGLPFRRLILPAFPPTWVHIGLTRKLAFPAKSDATLLASFLSGDPALIQDPRALIRRFEPVLGSGRCSDGMVESFENFRSAFLAGERMLAEHPFWRLARFCSPGSKREEEPEAELVCTFDEDGTPIFSAFRDDGLKLTAGPTTLAEAVAAMGRAGEAAAPTLKRGFLVFHQTGYGRWKSAPGLEGISGQVRLGCSPQAHLRLRQHRNLFGHSGSWLFTANPISAAIADECAGLFGASELVGSRLSSVSVFGGVRTGRLWLGRSAFLPRISAAVSAVTARPAAGAQGELQALSKGDGTARLISNGPVSGSWFIEPVEGRAWSRRVSFAADAFVHENLDASAQGFIELMEWGSGKEGPVRCTSALSSRSCDPRMSDLVEAIYAGGRSGWDEADVVALIQDAYGREHGPWAVLRVLRDATFIQARLRPFWKGRVWTLRPPALRRLGEIAIAEGAVCERVAQEFRAACEAAGGVAFCNSTVDPLAPPLLGCKGEFADVIARRLGWELVDGAIRPEGRQSFNETSLRVIGRRPASRWDWDRSRFVPDEREGEGEISLTRWTQTGGPDHDIYTVQRRRDGKQHKLLSRAAAVALAHSLAGVPLFMAGEGFIVGLAKEAALPDMVAAYLRLRHAFNPGLCEGSYVAKADERDLAWLSGLLPGLVSAREGLHRKTGPDAVSYSRHSSGKIRLAWLGGKVTVIPARL